MRWGGSVWLVLFSLVGGCASMPTDPPSRDRRRCSCVLVHHEAPPTQESFMASRELNPQFYEASRAGRVIQHHLNTLYGSPFRVYMVTQVHRARTEDAGEDSVKYVVEFSAKDWAAKGSEFRGSAEILYPRGDVQLPPQVLSSPDGILLADTSEKEQAFYQRYRSPGSALTAKDIPDSYGHIDPELRPFWHFAWAASSFIMLNASSENTLYGLAQVAKVTQLKSPDDRLRFEFQVLLHDMVSQEIIRWKLLVSWSPADGVKVFETELLPRCHCN